MPENFDEAADAYEAYLYLNGWGDDSFYSDEDLCFVQNEEYYDSLPYNGELEFDPLA